jgi:hypothetical protein
VSGLEQDLACGEDAQQRPFKTALADLRTLLGQGEGEGEGEGEG